MLSICVSVKEGREPQGILWVGGSLRGCCGQEGASGDVTGRREPFVCVCNFVYTCAQWVWCVCMCICLCVCIHVCVCVFAIVSGCVSACVCV